MKNGNPKENSRSLYYLTLLLILAGLSLTAFQYLDYQKEFLIRNINIVGMNEVGENEIVQLSGINKGMHLLRLNIPTVNIRLMQHPYIWNARVSKIFPNTVLIHVYEREPIAQINLDKSYALDKFGAFLPSPHHSEHPLPLISGLEAVNNFHLGKSSTHHYIRQGIDIINQINTRYPSTLSTVTELHWDKDEKSWVLILNSKRPYIKLGDSELSGRLKILDAYLTDIHINNKTITQYRYIDLRYKDQVVVNRGS